MGHRIRTVRLAAVLALSPVSATFAQPPQASPPDMPVIVTVGEATVRRAPDRAFMTVSVETRARSPREAQRLNAEAMSEVQQRITAARIPKEAVRTLGYDLQQEVDFVQGRRVPREFVARNAVEIRVDEVARTGEIMDAVVQGGATSLANLRSICKTAPPPNAKRCAWLSPMPVDEPMRPLPARVAPSIV